MQPIKVLFVCLGNICRSPIAHGIMQDKINKNNLTHLYEIDSAGTSGFHIGHEPDSRSINIAKSHGVLVNHKARQLTQHDITHYNYILAMDHLNYDAILNLSSTIKTPTKHVFLLRSFDLSEKNEFDIPDPYYGLENDFEEVYKICERSINGLLNYIEQEHR
ncbi:MAG: low molecular weight phosphotyrosine protein phosphatase [Proteobacteria bacterium]|jgi:protein-tyrosine phosphatase|nr:low molecular weight phosphotyrosine protein phosphatase [Pseudomonadota bacterium]